MLVILLSAGEGKVALGTCKASWERAVLKLSTVNPTCDLECKFCFEKLWTCLYLNIFCVPSLKSWTDLFSN